MQDSLTDVTSHLQKYVVEICTRFTHTSLVFISFLFPNSVFKEILAGVVVITGKEAVQHQGITLTMEGLVNLQLSSKSVGVFEAFYNSVKVSGHTASC